MMSASSIHHSIADPLSPFGVPTIQTPGVTTNTRLDLGVRILFPEDSCQTCAPDLINDVDGYKNRTLDSILAAGGCTLTTAEPTRPQSAVVIQNKSPQNKELK